MKKDQSQESETRHSSLGAVSGSFTDKDIYDAARSEYFRRYSGYTDEQIQLDRSRELQVEAFKKGAEWAFKNCH